MKKNIILSAKKTIFWTKNHNFIGLNYVFGPKQQMWKKMDQKICFFKYEDYLWICKNKGSEVQLSLF